MIVRAKGLLFDLDGTLIDSLPAVDRAWSHFANRHGFEPEFVRARIHGRRSIDSIRELVPHVDPEEEDRWIRNLESTDTTGVVALAGSKALLEALPLDRWCVVTSGTSDVALARIAATGLPLPRYAVFGEDVQRGKPDPEPFAMGAARLGLAPADCLGFEDTDAGIASVRTSGARPVAVGRPPMLHLDGVRVTVLEDGLELEIPDGAFV
jgi:sugar-phosphatase